MSVDILTPLEKQGLPSAPYAERVFIGGLFVAPHRFTEFRDVLAVADFTVEKHRLIFAACLKLYERGSAIDRVMVYQALSDEDRVRIGGLSGLAEIDAPEILNLESYVQQIRDAAVKRRLILGARKIALTACDRDTSAEIALEKARTFVQDLEASAKDGESEFLTPMGVIEDAGGIDNYLRVGSSSGVPLPWPKVEAIIGGLQPGDLAILAADTGRGKTAAALNIALRTAENRMGTAIFSMEMTRRQVMNRLMSLSGRFNSFLFRQKDRRREDENRIYAAASYLTDLPLYIRDSTGGRVAGIIGSIQRLRAKREVKLIIVDYLQLLSGDGRSRAEIVGGIARGLKNAAMELKVPILALSQLSRDHSKAKTEPELHDLRESGDIEQAANIVLFLHGETTYSVLPSELLPIDMIVAKQRDGQAKIKIPLMFQADCGHFQEV